MGLTAPRRASCPSGTCSRRTGRRLLQAGPRPGQRTRHASPPGPLPPWPWQAVSPGRPVRASPYRIVHGNGDVPRYGDDLLASRDGSDLGRGGETVMDFYETLLLDSGGLRFTMAREAHHLIEGR